MSVSTPNSILKSTNFTGQWSSVKKVRFRVQHANKLYDIFTEYLQDGNIRNYQNLLCMIRDSEISNEDLLLLLQTGSNCISLISMDLHLFVEAVLYIDWINRSTEVCKEYQSFIVNLLSAHTYHAELVINQLVYLFVKDQEYIDEQNPDLIQAYTHVHSLLKMLVKTVPMSRDILRQALITNFPYLRKPPGTHKLYIHNLLQFIEYEPTLQSMIINLIISKLIVMDVKASRSEINRLLLESNESTPMDDDFRSITTTASTPQSLDTTIHTLDICLNNLYKYLRKKCHPNDELNWKSTKNIYQDFLSAFDTLILPTYNLDHVQFLLFFLCSFKSTLCDGFLIYLWKIVCNPNKPAVLRQSAVNYICSFIVRANFVSLSLLKSTLNQFCEWIHAYIMNENHLEYNTACDTRIHLVFYTVCQAVFYTVASKYRDLTASKKHLIFLNGLNLAKIVTCPLNPLRVCNSIVVQQFAAITRKYQLAYCYTIMEHNSRDVLPAIYRDEKGAYITTKSSVLDAIYPFDPYLLTVSSDEIYPIYNETLPVFNPVNNRLKQDEDMECDDDFLNNDLQLQ